MGFSSSAVKIANLFVISLFLSFVIVTSAQQEEQLPSSLEKITRRTRAKSISVGGEFICIITEHDQLNCLDRLDGLRLGVTKLVDLGFEKVHRVSVGARHACAIQLSPSLLKCWVQGQEPVVVNVTGKEQIIDVRAGDGFTCVLFASLQVSCFGQVLREEGSTNGKMNSLEAAANVDRIQVIDFSDNNSKVQQLTVGGHHACVLLTDGTVKCWGSNTYGQLIGPIGDQRSNHVESSNKTVASLVDLGNNKSTSANKIKQVEAGGFHTCVLWEDGDLKCFGRNDQGQLGSNSSQQLLGQQQQQQRAMSDIVLGEKTSCVRLIGEDSFLYKCWGEGMMTKGKNDASDLLGRKFNQLKASSLVSLGRFSKGGKTSACALVIPTRTTYPSSTSGGMEVLLPTTTTHTSSTSGEVVCLNSLRSNDDHVGSMRTNKNSIRPEELVQFQSIDLVPPLTTALPDVANLFEEEEESFTNHAKDSISCNRLWYMTACRRVRAYPEQVFGMEELRFQYDKGAGNQVGILILKSESSSSSLDYQLRSSDGGDVPYSHVRLDGNSELVVAEIILMNGETYELRRCVPEEQVAIGKGCYIFVLDTTLGDEGDDEIEMTEEELGNSNILNRKKEYQLVIENIQTLYLFSLVSFGVWLNRARLESLYSKIVRYYDE